MLCDDQCFDKSENLEYTNSQPQAHGSTEVGEKIAEVKDLPIADVLKQTYQNSLREFFPAG